MRHPTEKIVNRTFFCQQTGRKRGGRASPGAGLTPAYPMLFCNGTQYCSELNREHAGECFRSLRRMGSPLWACKCETSVFAEIWHLTWPNEVKCWPITKKYVQSRDLVETHRLFFFFAKLYDNRGPIARGSYPPTGEGGNKRNTGENTAHVNGWFQLFTWAAGVKIFVCFTYRIFPFETFEFFCSCIRDPWLMPPDI